MNQGSNELKTVVNEATCILLDVEGTTTSIDFVRKDLFGYGIENVEMFVVDHWEDTEVQKVVKEIANLEKREDGLAICDKPMSVKDTDIRKIQETVISKLKNEMKSSQKSPAVKELEGLICMNGFIKGELIGHVYPDVVDAFKAWNTKGKNIYIYSNGSVQSQCILFKHSIYGDLTKYISGNFDTHVGSKLDPVSYSTICQTVGKLPNEVIFFSDRPKELFAAKETGLKTVLVVRNPECLTFADEMCYLELTHPSINSFLEVLSSVEKEN